ncbi:MAG: 5-formyltetrahydrofolate cyclo-ligase [Candidatus Omnitrophica bacterium]|nr:5-formyltetrahydrofolate cyclo-ligase [Candidatus Omnitrophota bacterium]
MNDKGSFREHFLGLLKKQGSRERSMKSRGIAGQLFILPAFQRAKTVLFYASLPGEVDSFAMIEQAKQLQKNVALPVLVRDQRKMIPILTDSINDLQDGPYGVRQPRLDPSKIVDLSSIDAVVVPGLAFDRAYNRLGRGAGYYDRFLSRLADSAVTIGVAFDFQIVDCLPVEEHDVPLDFVIAG